MYCKCINYQYNVVNLLNDVQFEYTNDDHGERRKYTHIAYTITRGYLQIYFSSRRGYEFEIYAKQVALSGREIPM